MYSYPVDEEISLRSCVCYSVKILCKLYFFFIYIDYIIDNIFHVGFFNLSKLIDLSDYLFQSSSLLYCSVGEYL